MLSMDISHKVFCSLGKVHYGLQIDDFRAGAFCVGKGLGENFQQSEVLSACHFFYHPLAIIWPYDFVLYA